MENKLNVAELKAYSRQCAKKMSNEFFKNGKTQIVGSEILEFSKIEQVNYFILKNIFFQWKEETHKVLQSPYFDYQHPEVVAAVQHLANVLSNYIQVSPYHLELLLSEAVEETIYLSLSPYHYFRQYYFPPEKVKVTLEELREKAKYLRINRAFFIHFIEKLETYRINSFQVADIMGYFQEAYYNTSDTFDSHEPIVHGLAVYEPMDLSKIVTDLKRKDDYTPTPLEVFELKKATETQPMPAAKTAQAEEPQKMTAVPITLNLNQRIMFLKHLFSNDIEQMNHTLARLETCGTLHNAKYILGFFNWDLNNEIVQEFYELVERKYSK